MNNLHVLKVIFLGQTNTKPNRVKITSERFEQSIIISRYSDKATGDYVNRAADHLESKGFNIIGRGMGKDFAYLITDTFEPLK